jgi:hypothetical protein
MCLIGFFRLVGLCPGLYVSVSVILLFRSASQISFSECITDLSFQSLFVFLRGEKK